MYAAPPTPGRDEDMSDWTTDAANAIDNAVGMIRERHGAVMRKYASARA